MAKTQPVNSSARMDYLTLVAIALIAFTLSLALHEQLGHGAMCALLGGKLVEISALNYDCAYGGVTEWLIRLITISGPLVNAGAGILSFALLAMLPKPAPHFKFLFWLFGSVSLMTASGQLIFAGLTGAGDFGLQRDGLLYQLEPAVLWRVVVFCLGVGVYSLALLLSRQRLNLTIGGASPERMRRAWQLVGVSYASQLVLALFIGLFSPFGFSTYESSSAVSSLAGTLGLFLVARQISPQVNFFSEQLVITRNWWWIMSGLTSALLYALIIAPSVHF